MKLRIESLDYFRGVMAAAVMIYHYTLWYAGDVSYDSLLAKMGIYAVSIFYILSGVSLGLVNQNKVFSSRNIKNYFMKRFFRIAPLFWLCLTVAILYKVIYYNFIGGEGAINLYHVFLNYTLLFGFIEPSAYLSTGAWSIGNEIVFYSLFPLSILFARKVTLLCILPISLFLYSYFAFIVMDHDMSVDSQWENYVNPFNQWFLFVAGNVLALYRKEIGILFRRQLVPLLTLIVWVCIFVYFPVGDDSFIISGWTRISLSFLSILMVLSVLYISTENESYIEQLLSLLGACSYSIYLLHPLVSYPLVFVFKFFSFDLLYAYLLSAVLTLCVSYITYNYFEKPILKLSNRFTEKKMLLSSAG